VLLRRPLSGIEHSRAHSTRNNNLGPAFALRQEAHDLNAVETWHHQIKTLRFLPEVPPLARKHLDSPFFAARDHDHRDSAFS
jgi:hypothetical protein